MIHHNLNPTKSIFTHHNLYLHYHYHYRSMASTHQQQDEEDDYHKDGHSMSRLSLRAYDHGCGGTRSHMSLLSIEKFSVPEAGCYSLCRRRRLQSSVGESDRCGVMVITRPQGGTRSLCMDMEEVKGCYDLGFELMPCISVNLAGGPGLSFNTSSGSNWAIANWRISSPGDDPRDVKARLRVWAQAVALASTSRKGLDFYS